MEHIELDEIFRQSDPEFISILNRLRVGEDIKAAMERLNGWCGEPEGDHDITDVGRDARMPWQIDGRHWHTVDRVGRTGNPCRSQALRSSILTSSFRGIFSPTGSPSSPS